MDDDEPVAEVEAGELESLQAATALPAVVAQLTRLGWQLDAHSVKDDKWAHALRTLYQVDVLGGYQLVAVAGGQGAGKTTLVGNLYPQAAAWLEPNPGRGEKTPVAIVETAGISRPRGVVIRRVSESTHVEPETYGADRLTEWRRILKGEDQSVLMVRLEVPLDFWSVDRTGFVLLPGFERLTEGHWQSLMRIILVTSPAVVVVTDAERLADATQQTIITDVRTAGLADAPPVELVVALSRSDGKPADVVKGLVDQAVQVYGVKPGWVVPIGPDLDSPPGWKDRFKAAVKGILPAATHARRHEVALLREVVRTDIADVITLAQGALDRQARDDLGAAQYALLMREFDQQRDNVLSTLDSDLRARFGEQGQLGAAGKRLNEKFGGASGAKELLRRGVDWAKIDPHGKDRRLLAMVQEAWAPDDARKEQARCLDTVAEQMRAVVTAGAEDLSAEIFRSLITLDRINPEDQNLFRAIRMLPMMALETRAFAITYADASGSVTVPEGRPLRQGVEMLDEDRRTMLAGAAVLLGADFGADADLDAPAAIASAITSLLTGGGGAAGASAVAPALVGTVAVGLTAAVVVQAGNRAMKERNRIGHSLLKAHQLATVEHIRNSVVELMRLTREVLASRLHYALRLDDAQIRQFALLQAIRDTERARGRMLEVLGGRHVA